MSQSARQRGSRFVILVMALALLWAPLTAYAAVPTTQAAGTGDMSSGMPCHARQAEAEPQHAPCPYCDQGGLGCSCCDQAVPGSLPGASRAPGEPHFLRASHPAEALPFSPEPPPRRHLRPPRT